MRGGSPPGWEKSVLPSLELRTPVLFALSELMHLRVDSSSLVDAFKELACPMCEMLLTASPTLELWWEVTPHIHVGQHHPQTEGQDHSSL